MQNSAIKEKIASFTESVVLEALSQGWIWKTFGSWKWKGAREWDLWYKMNLEDIPGGVQVGYVIDSEIDKEERSPMQWNIAKKLTEWLCFMMLPYDSPRNAQCCQNWRYGTTRRRYMWPFSLALRRTTQSRKIANLMLVVWQVTCHKCQVNNIWKQFRIQMFLQRFQLSLIISVTKYTWDSPDAKLKPYWSQASKLVYTLK